MPHHRNLAPPTQRGADRPVIHDELRSHYDDLYDLLLNGRRARDARPVLDVGSGDGLALSAIMQGTPLHGIAIDSSATGPWLGPSDWALVQADAQRLPFADSRFRSAMMVDVLEWLRHPAATLREIARTTDGPILIVQTDWEGLWFQVDRAEIGRDLVRGFTKGAPEELRGLIRSATETAGVTVTQMSSVSIQTNRLDQGSLAWDVLESIRRFLVIESAQVRARRFDDWRSELQLAADEGQFSMLVRRVVALVEAGEA
ncbi:MAG: methyltransferase domain-containing protein [Chloroflexi bacterium]|nr:methyltransferase domain-containing protein [Chloroflexota bacterium]